LIERGVTNHDKHSSIESNHDQTILDALLTLNGLVRKIIHKNELLQTENNHLRQIQSKTNQNSHNIFEESKNIILKVYDEKKMTEIQKNIELRSLEGKIIELEKELENKKNILEINKIEYSKLFQKYSKTQTQLLEMPRVEESYMRAAKAQLRSKEISLNERELKFNRSVVL
jgi:hypothetical protein